MAENRIVPEPTMDSVPISRLDELQAHLAELLDSPDTPINARLLDEVELQLTGTPLFTFFIPIRPCLCFFF